MVRRTDVRVANIVLILLTLVAACAVMESPSGGPEDKVPPRVVGTVPRLDSTGVAPDVHPVFTFSERMDDESFKNRVLVFPSVPFERLKVRGERLEIAFGRPLPDTTVCLLLRPGYRDNHLVASPMGYALYFATADSMARGEVSGLILFKEKPDSTGVAELFELRADTVVKVETQKPSRIAVAELGGYFSFRGLPTDGARFILWAFTDRDGDGHFSASREFAALFPDTIVLTEREPRVENVRVKIIDPNEPGSIAGRVVNETSFKELATIRLEPLFTGERPRVARADSTGSFLVGSLKPGAYRLSAFIDIKPDTVCGTYVEQADTTKALPEPCVTVPDTIVVKPGEAKTVPVFNLK
jgi:hypothetical protein